MELTCKKGHCRFISSLLRFEEKNVFRKEIEQLNDRVDEEERNTNELEQLLRFTKAENVTQLQQMKHLQNEQQLGEKLFHRYIQ